MTPDPLHIARQLIQIPSVNPMGRTVPDDIALEHRMGQFLAKVLRDHGIEHEIWDVAPHRPNLLARIGKQDAQRTILLDAHSDTVPVDGMTIPPFKPSEHKGKLYGRGACDVKGPMAAMLTAFLRLANADLGDTSILFSATCDEEAGQLGMADLVRRWTDPNRTSQIAPRRPDFAIVAEPTDLNIVVAHRGAVRWTIRTTGRACHSSKPEDGVNAIYRMAQLVTRLEAYAEELPSLHPPHPRCGPASLSVGRITGGTSINIVPDTCEIEIDRRTLPGESTNQVMADLRNYCQPHLDFEFEFSEPVVGFPLSDDNNIKPASQLLNAIERVAGPHCMEGALYGTHASRLDAANIPTVVFGPGSITQAHTKDEWITISELNQASQIYHDFCLAFDNAN